MALEVLDDISLEQKKTRWERQSYTGKTEREGLTKWGTDPEKLCQSSSYERTL